MFTPPPDEKKLAEIAAFGMTPEDVGLGDKTIEIWQCNEQAVDLFITIRTQWIVGAGGPIGLNYSVLFRLLDNMRIDQEAWNGLFNDIRVMEIEALDAMREET